jgi:hypothetical protein
LTFRDSLRLKAEIISDETMKEAKRNPIENLAGSERRRSTRYQIRGATWFQWEAEHGERREGTGVTHDISKAGAFIETAARPPVGARVKVVVTVSSGANGEMQVRLCGAGDVRHVQHDAEPESGFGAWVGFHTAGAQTQ